MMYRKIHSKILLTSMHTLIRSSFCVLKSVLPARRPSSAEVAARQKSNSRPALLRDPCCQLPINRLPKFRPTEPLHQ